MKNGTLIIGQQGQQAGQQYFIVVQFKRLIFKQINLSGQQGQLKSVKVNKSELGGKIGIIAL